MTLPTWVQYVDALGPLLALIAGLIAAVIAYRTYRHRRTQDRKEEWWRRTQWALDHAMSDDEHRRTIGVSVLTLQASSELADAEDQKVMDAVADQVLERIETLRANPQPKRGIDAPRYDETQERRPDDILEAGEQPRRRRRVRRRPSLRGRGRPPQTSDE